MPTEEVPAEILAQEHIDAVRARIKGGDYQTKAQKMALLEELREARRDLRRALGLPIIDQ